MNNTLLIASVPVDILANDTRMRLW